MPEEILRHIIRFGKGQSVSDIKDALQGSHIGRFLDNDYNDQDVIDRLSSIRTFMTTQMAPAVFIPVTSDIKILSKGFEHFVPIKHPIGSFHIKDKKKEVIHIGKKAIDHFRKVWEDEDEARASLFSSSLTFHKSLTIHHRDPDRNFKKEVYRLNPKYALLEWKPACHDPEPIDDIFNEPEVLFLETVQPQEIRL